MYSRSHVIAPARKGDPETINNAIHTHQTSTFQVPCSIMWFMRVPDYSGRLLVSDYANYDNRASKDDKVLLIEH
jgi:hypothetical protein